MSDYMKKFMAFFKDEAGASLVEYVLLLMFIALVCVTAIGLIGGSLVPRFEDVADGFGN